MRRNIFIVITFMLLITGCSSKVTVDYRDFKSSNYRVTKTIKDKFQSSDFDSLIKKYAKKYGVDKKLVKAIIKKESNFNPRAVNKVSGATGLMQIKPETAGADVYQRIFKKSGRPSRYELMNPNTNIEIGVAYLTILEKYLGKIDNKDSLEFCIVASFNSGAGAVLEVFSKDRKKATRIINDLTPNEVYHILTTKHPRGETRDYVQKVLAYKNIVNI